MKKIILLPAVALALASCDNNDDNIVPLQEQARITATIGENVSTRAKDTSWGNDDKIGISSTVGTVVGPYTNLEYTTGGNGTFTGTPIFFYKPMTLTAYYPFTGSEGTAPGLIEAITNADNQAPENQPKIDFLFDSVTDIKAALPHTNVNFKFTHKMSKLTFVFEGTEEEKDEKQGIYIPGAKVSDMVSYEIEGLVLDGTFDTATGVCAVKNDVEAKNLKIELDKGSFSDDVSEVPVVSMDPLIVFPQTPGNSNVKLHVYTDELNDETLLQHYICPLTFSEGELKPGNNYKYTVRITKVGLVLKEIKIEDWNLGRDVNLTATIDGGWKPDEKQQ